MVCSQIEVSDDLISSWVACRAQVHWGKIFGLNEYDPVFIRDGDVYLGDALSVLSVGRGAISLPELEGEVLKGGIPSGY